MEKRMEKRKNISDGRIMQGEWIYPSLIVILGFCYYLSYINYGIRLSDEGFFVYGAERTLQGQLPMSDFFSYSPGSYFLLALLFKTFGVDLLISRLMEVFFLLANGLMMFYIGKRSMPKSWALIPSFILVAFPGPWYKVFFVFGLLLPLCTLINYLEKRTVSRILLVGWATGIALIFKIEPALYSSLMTWMVLFGAHILKEGSFHLTKERAFDFLKDMLLWSLALMSLLLPFLIYYYSKSALGNLFLYLVETYGFTNVEGVGEFFENPSFLKAFTRFHFGSLHNQFFFIILFLYIYMLLKLFFHFFIRKRNDLFLLFPVVIMGILSLSYAYISFSKSYFQQVAAPAYILLGYILYSTSKARSMKARVWFFVIILLSSVYLLDSLKLDLHSPSSINTLVEARKEGVGLLLSKKARVYVRKNQLVTINGLIDFFRGKDGSLMPFYYDPMVNFLTGLENPTKYSILSPSYLRATGRQEQVIEEMERYKVKYLLIRQPMWVSQDSRLGVSKYAPILYKFVLRQYELEKEIGGYLIFSRLK